MVVRTFQHSNVSFNLAVLSLNRINPSRLLQSFYLFKIFGPRLRFTCSVDISTKLFYFLVSAQLTLNYKIVSLLLFCVEITNDHWKE